MNDMSVPISRAVAYGTWLIASLALAAAWAVSAWASAWVGNLLATTAACLFAAAAVAQVRWYLVRLSRLIRLAGQQGAARQDDPSGPRGI